MERDQKINPLTSDKLTGLKLRHPPTIAAGWTGIGSTLKYISSETGFLEGLKLLGAVNQMDGFDCPGCAWPDPDNDRSQLGEFCENGAKAIAEEATMNRIGPEFFRRFSVAELSEKSDFWIGKQGRLTHPMILGPGKKHYSQISWEQAFKTIADELNNLNNPDEAIFYTSGRTSNEAAFLYQLFVREYGTNNLPDCSNMCHESSGVALSETLGIGKGSVKLEDFYQTELIIVIGQNPGTNHPRMLSALQKAKSNGARIITINPLPEAGLMKFRNPQKLKDMLGGGTELTDLFIPVRINGDVALLKAIMLRLIELESGNPGGVLDQGFIETRTSGYKDFVSELRKHDFSKLCRMCGLKEKPIIEASELIAKSKKIIVCWAMGLTQHKNAVDNIREVVNLLLMKGSIGKPGAGTCPVRGHSNVQGDRTMGIWENPTQTFLNKLKEVFGIEPPRQKGFNTVEAIEAMLTQKARVFFAMGGNFLSATPDTELTAKALQSCNLTVHVSTKLNRSHLIHGKKALILPCLGRTELDMTGGRTQFVSVENSMGIVHKSQGRKKPASSNLKSEPEIVAGLALATFGAKTKVDWEKLIINYDNIRDKVEAVVPGFGNYNERVRQDGGFYLPNRAREGSFLPGSNKAVFTVNSVSDVQLDQNEFLMMTVRSHDQFNTTIYGLNDRYRGVFNERRVIFMNREDMGKLGISPKQLVDLTSFYDGVERKAPRFHAVPFNIPRQCVATYFPETNVLVPINEVADGSNTPVSKSIVISIDKSQ